MAMLDWPSAIPIDSVQLEMRRTISRDRSAYSYGDQSLDWGGEVWVATVRTPRLTIEDRAALGAYIERARDTTEKARFGLYRDLKFGTSDGNSVVVAAAGAAYQRSVSLSGIGAGATLKAGTFISIASRLYMLRQDVTGDAAVATVTPRLRESVSLSDPVNVGSQAVGVWRPEEVDPVLFYEDPDLAKPVSIKFMEAIA